MRDFDTIPPESRSWPNEELRFFHDGHGVMDFFVVGFRTQVVANTVCATGMYTHLLVARRFFCT